MSRIVYIVCVAFVIALTIADTCLGLDQFLTEQQQSAAKNPGEITFKIRLKENKDQFYQGDLIQVELSFASTAKDKHQLDGAEYDRSGRLESDAYHLDPSSGAEDPLKDRDPGVIGGGLRSMPILDHKPYLITRDLNEYLRIDKPGKYRLYVVSDRLQFEDKTKHSLTTIPTTSNIIEFTIIPMNASWERKQFQSAVETFKGSDHLDPVRRDKEIRSAARLLRFLGTPDAVQYMVRHFNEAEADFGFGLIGSPHRAMVIKEMEDGIEKPDYPITDWYLSVLTICKHARRMAPYPSNEDKAKLEVWEQREREAQLARTAIRIGYVTRMASAISSKQGAAKAISLNTLLAETMQQPKDRQAISVAGMEQNISSELTQVFFDLPARTQQLLLEYQWPSIKSSGMLPVLEQLYAHQKDTYNPTISDVALQRIYELDPKRGRELILKEIANPTGRARFEVLSMLPDKALPEMDEAFAAVMEKRGRTMPKQLPLHMKLLSRYGTPAILPRIKAVMRDPNWSFWCEVEAPVIAYFLRVDPAFGTAELERALARSSENGCNKYVLGAVAELYTSPGLESAAVRQLNNPDQEIVLKSIEVLGKYGSAEAEAPLLKRFQKWHDEWKDRTEELQNPMIGRLPPELINARRMDSAFRTALANAQGWIADAAKLKVIQALCLTDLERDQVGYLISKADAPKKRLSFLPGRRDSWLFDIAQYQLSSLEAAKNKLAQFPRGTVFVWNPFNAGQAEDQKNALLKELKGYLSEIGMALEEQ